MNILQSLEAYSSAQKVVGNNFIILGSLLLVLGLVFFVFVDQAPMAAGMKWGALVTGAMIIIGGLSYRSYTEKSHAEFAEVYHSDRDQFVKAEHERMEKVFKGFLVYQIVFAAFIVAALMLILFLPSPVVKGASFTVAILFIGIMLIEGFSHKSIKEYTIQLRQEINK